MGAERTEGTEEDEGAFIHVVRWLGHHGNRLYGFMRLRSKMSEWMDGWMDGVDTP